MAVERWALVAVVVASSAALAAWVGRARRSLNERASDTHRLRAPVVLICAGLVLVAGQALIGTSRVTMARFLPSSLAVSLLDSAVVVGALLLAVGLGALAPMSWEGFTDAVLGGGGVTALLAALVGSGGLGAPAPMGARLHPLVPLLLVLAFGIAAAAHTLAALSRDHRAAWPGHVGAAVSAVLLAAVWVVPAGSAAGVPQLWASTSATVILGIAMVQLVVTAGLWPGPLPHDAPIVTRYGAETAWIALFGVAALAVRSTVDAVGSGGVRNSLIGPTPSHRDSIAWLLVAVLLVALVAALSQTRVTRRALSARLSRVDAQWEAMSDLSDDVVIELDELARISSVNHAAVSMLHRAPEALLGRSPGILVSAADRDTTWQLAHDVVHGELSSARLVVSLAPPAAGSAEIRLRAVPGGAVAIMTEATGVNELREHLSVAARYDSATGLANRHQMIEEVAAWLEQGRVASVLFVDVDRFKGINTRFGRDAGDAVLTGLARRLQAWARGWSGSCERRAMVARVVADEFAVALSDTSLRAAVHAAEEIRSMLLGSFEVAGHRLKVSISIGVAATDDGSGVDPEASAAHRSVELLERADLASAAAKSLGHSQVATWEMQLTDRARRDVDVAIGLRRALDTGRLDVAFQPIVRLSDGVVVGAEALIRLPRRPPGGLYREPVSFQGQEAELELADLVTPAELVEVAEITGEIDELGHWVLSEAVRQAARWRDLGHDVRVNVNMSVRQLSSAGFLDVVRTTLASVGLEPNRLAIEITEGQLLGEGERADSTVQQLRRDGVMLAIDDFGSGYSSLSYLRRMPVQTVKIDRSLLAGVGHDPRATTVVRAVLSAARGLGMHVVCEGIEDLAMARTLRDLGAWAGQGYALYPAMDAMCVLDVLDRPPVDLSNPSVSKRETVSRRD